MAAETLRNRLRQAEVDAGETAGVTSETARELRELKRKNGSSSSLAGLQRNPRRGSYGPVTR